MGVMALAHGRTEIEKHFFTLFIDIANWKNRYNE